MANEPGILEESLLSTGTIKAPGGRPAPPPAWLAPGVFDFDNDDALGPETKGVSLPDRQQSFTGAICVVEPGSDFFENIILLPQSINTGIVVGVLNFTIDIYSSYRNQVHSFLAFSQTAGDGISITDLPALPALIPAQTGFTLTLEVLPEGPANIAGDLLFDFDVDDGSIPILGSRAVVFPIQPERPLTEILESKTNVLRKSHGTEQRRKLRFAPRQIFVLTFKSNGFQRKLLDTTIMGAQSRATGLPVWHEAVESIAAVAISATTINIETTSFADYRVGGLAIMWNAEDDFEVLEIAAGGIGATSLTFASPFTKAFPSGILVMPLRTAFMSAEVTGSKFPLNLQETKITFTVIDNEVDLSDATAFPTFNSKVLLDEPNMIRGTLGESMRRNIIVVDSQVGPFSQFSDEDISRRGSVKMFFSRTRQRLWEVRQLIHFLNGRQTSFYLPTFFDEFEITQNIVSASDKLTFKNMGYTDILESRQPRDVVQLVKTDGTKVIRSVLSSIELSDEEEQITLAATWGINATIAEVDRISYVEKVRFDSDRVTIRHRSSLGNATISAPIITVNE